MSDIVEDMRAVDPVAYIRATGLRPEDSYGFLPIDVNEASSFFFLYRDRPEYAEARQALPAATTVKDIDLGVVHFGVGQGRQVDVDVPSEAPGGRVGDLIAQAQAMQQQYTQMYGAMMPQDTEAAQVQRLDQLKASGVLDKEGYDAALYGIQGGHAGANPGGAPAAPAPPDAPPIAIHRLYPRLNKRSLDEQFEDFLPPYREALGLCPEDVYGVFPRHTLHSSGGDGSVTSWEDYWLVYRDRPEYAQGRAAWAERMNAPGGWSERLIGGIRKTSWPEAEIVPGVAEASSATFDTGDTVEVDRDGWPRRALILREKGSDLGDELRERIDRRGYAPEDSFGLCPDFNSNRIYFAWRRR